MSKKKRKIVFTDFPENDAQLPAIRDSVWAGAIRDRNPKIYDAIFEYLAHFEAHQYTHIGQQGVKCLDQFVQAVFSVLLCDSLKPSKEQAWKLCSHAYLFNSLVAISSFEITTPIVKALSNVDSNFPKVLFTLNNRSTVQLNPAELFDVSEEMASLWYQQFILGISSPNPTIQRNLVRHLEAVDSRFQTTGHCLSALYFACTYHAPHAARKVKSIINAAVKKTLASRGSIAPFTNDPDPKSIGIITNKWHRNHAVYKSMGRMVEELVPDYRMTLIWTGKEMPPNAVTDYFDKVVYCYFEDDALIVPPELQHNDFGLIYFPDIGMSDESIWLSNCRMAPVQVMGYGHPDTSGDGSEIDYFIGSEYDDPSAYAEQLVKLPGLAQVPANPTAERTGSYTPNERVRVNCVLGPDKYNYTWLQMLKAISSRATREHDFHFYASPGINRYCALPAFIRDVKRILPNVVIHNQIEYFDYMKSAERGDFSINSFPFGGYNTVVESMYLGLPMVTIYGNRFYNYAAKYLNDKACMSDMNCTTPEQLIELCAKLIDDPEYLKTVRSRLVDFDMARLNEPSGNFKKAIDSLVKGAGCES